MDKEYLINIRHKLEEKMLCINLVTKINYDSSYIEKNVDVESVKTNKNRKVKSKDDVFVVSEKTATINGKPINSQPVIIKDGKPVKDKSAVFFTKAIAKCRKKMEASNIHKDDTAFYFLVDDYEALNTHISSVRDEMINYYFDSKVSYDEQDAITFYLSVNAFPSASENHPLKQELDESINKLTEDLIFLMKIDIYNIGGAAATSFYKNPDNYDFFFSQDVADAHREYDDKSLQYWYYKLAHFTSNTEILNVKNKNLTINWEGKRQSRLNIAVTDLLRKSRLYNEILNDKNIAKWISNLEEAQTWLSNNYRVNESILTVSKKLFKINYKMPTPRAKKNNIVTILRELSENYPSTEQVDLDTTDWKLLLESIKKLNTFTIEGTKPKNRIESILDGRLMTENKARSKESIYESLESLIDYLDRKGKSSEIKLDYNKINCTHDGENYFLEFRIDNEAISLAEFENMASDKENHDKLINASIFCRCLRCKVKSFKLCHVRDLFGSEKITKTKLVKIDRAMADYGIKFDYDFRRLIAVRLNDVEFGYKELMSKVSEMEYDELMELIMVTQVSVFSKTKRIKYEDLYRQTKSINRQIKANDIWSVLNESDITVLT